MKWPLSRGWTILIIAGMIPIFVWFVFQLWQGSQTGKLGHLPKLQIETSSYTFNNSIFQQILRVNTTQAATLRKVYRIDRNVGTPEPLIQKLQVVPVTVNSSVNAYENKTSKLLMTHDKVANVVILLPDVADQVFLKDTVKNHEQATDVCRQVVTNLETVNPQDLESSEVEVLEQGGVYRVLFWRTIQQERIYYSADNPALVDCSIKPEGIVTSLTVQLDTLSANAQSPYRAVSVGVSASNVLNNSWPYSIDLYLSPENTGNNYTLTPRAARSITIDDTKNVSLLYCDKELCYTYPGYEVKATLQIVSDGVSSTYPGYARLYLPALESQYWQ